MIDVEPIREVPQPTPVETSVKTVPGGVQELRQVGVTSPGGEKKSGRGEKIYSGDIVAGWEWNGDGRVYARYSSVGSDGEIIRQEFWRNDWKVSDEDLKVIHSLQGVVGEDNFHRIASSITIDGGGSETILYKVHVADGKKYNGVTVVYRQDKNGEGKYFGESDLVAATDGYKEMFVKDGQLKILPCGVDCLVLHQRLSDEQNILAVLKFDKSEGVYKVLEMQVGGISVVEGVGDVVLVGRKGGEGMIVSTVVRANSIGREKPDDSIRLEKQGLDFSLTSALPTGEIVAPVFDSVSGKWILKIVSLDGQVLSTFGEIKADANVYGVTESAQTFCMSRNNCVVGVEYVVDRTPRMALFQVRDGKIVRYGDMLIPVGKNGGVLRLSGVGEIDAGIGFSEVDLFFGADQSVYDGAKAPEVVFRIADLKKVR